MLVDVPVTPGEVCSRCGRLWPDGLSHCGWCGILGRTEPCTEHPNHLARWACAVCGRRLCRTCRRGRRHTALCRDHERLRVIEGWAEVARVTHEPDAELTAGELRAAGVPAQVLSQKDHANVVGFGALSVVRILVPAHRYLTARSVLDPASGGTGPGEPATS